MNKLIAVILMLSTPTGEFAAGAVQLPEPGKSVCGKDFGICLVTYDDMTKSEAVMRQARAALKAQAAEIERLRNGCRLERNS